MSLFWLLALLAPFAVAEDLVRGSQKIGVVFYKELIKKNDNLVISPFGVQNMLAVVEAGARGTTAEEIRDGSFFPNEEELQKEMQAFTITINTCSNLNVNNSFLINKNLPVNEDYRSTLKNVYQASFNTELDAVTELYSNIEYTAQFATVFSKLDTSTFNVDAANSVDYVPLYLNNIELNYADVAALDATIVEIPFANCDDLSFVIVVPNEVEGLSVIEENLDLAFTTPHFSKETIELTIPTFPFTGLNHDLGTIVKNNLGISTAFEEAADFTGISESAVDLHFAFISQYAAINIQADGANGASWIDGSLDFSKAKLIRDLNGDLQANDLKLETACKQAATNHKSVVANHPFFYYIKLKNVILLAGRVVKPKPVQ